MLSNFLIQSFENEPISTLSFLVAAIAAGVGLVKYLYRESPDKRPFFQMTFLILGTIMFTDAVYISFEQVPRVPDYLPESVRVIRQSAYFVFGVIAALLGVGCLVLGVSDRAFNRLARLAKKTTAAGQGHDPGEYKTGG